MRSLRIETNQGGRTSHSSELLALASKKGSESEKDALWFCRIAQEIAPLKYSPGDDGSGFNQLTCKGSYLSFIYKSKSDSAEGWIKTVALFRQVVELQFGNHGCQQQQAKTLECYTVVMLDDVVESLPTSQHGYDCKHYLLCFYFTWG